ncbi:ImmA/IrrE family metallo-endopeptidase [Brevibacillus sp. HB1.4B]|uniref:ImmA/IrrE family metallo-endopeptidase n=1 Tax=Brevibacillus sp. HB1.4B TaxID=2738845 RepID=UPI00156B691A|nr:ImmA/IrrE family metallo-endopeptidase [Brevibacillus sp. HB1.4B]NRS15862.1 ImmA/IrrE family metallo-endopeptidase [Brevibacillus sp. HB1.4B]
MKLFYTPTPLETWISHFYKQLGIKTPDELDEQRIARSLHIHLLYKEIPSMAYEFGRFKSITIDSRLPSSVQREHFYHELCHILRHAGRQIMMPAAFRELQEWDAKNFTRYAALPQHMLTRYDFRQPEILDVLSEQFKVTPELCAARLQKIQDKLKLAVV